MNSVRVLLEAISDNPWAAMGLGTWVLFVSAMVTSTGHDCLALLVTRSRPATGVESKYLLPEIARCAICGGGVIVRSRAHGRKRTYFYACSSYHQRGKSVCPNLLEDSMAEVDRAVLDAFEKQLLGPGMVDEILDAAVARMPSASADTQQDKTALTDAFNRVETEIGNLTAAVAAGGGEVAALVKGLKEREAECERLRRQLVNAERAEKRTEATPARLRAQLEQKLADWREVLRRQPLLARQIVKKLLVGPLLLTPKLDSDGSGYYAFEGEGTLAKMLVDFAHPITVASPTGFEPVFWP